ncbi:hypothetical protein BH11PLA2_BH11PLA2_40340 [soil metagenome]
MTTEALLLIAGSYLIGSIPFGYLIGRARGINLFTVGSGNIGATNVGRVLGAKFGVLCFVLDLIKGIGPVAVAKSLMIAEPAVTLTAAAAFVGHLFPLFLGFRGGKGIATGAGTVLVLVPIPAAAAFLAWALTVLASRTVSLASIAAVTALCSVQLIRSGDLLAPATVYCLVGTLFVLVKHRANIGRLINGTENTIGDTFMRQNLLRVLHVLAVSLWFGGAGFFNFVVAPSLFRSYAEVVETAPSDRTANLPLLKADTDEATKKKLAGALFGAGVGPVFPKYFAMMTACAVIALVTAFTWRRDGRVHRTRFLVALMALATIAVGWPISKEVTAMRLLRFHSNPDIAKVAVDAFATWHLVSLALSFITVILAGVLVVLCAWLPQKSKPLTTHDSI